MQQWHCGIIRFLSLSQPDDQPSVIGRHPPQSSPPSFFFNSFFISVLLLASVFSLMRINQKKFLLHGAQRALANGDNAFVHNTDKPQHSASLFPFCWAIPHVRQTRRNRSFPSPITNNKIPPLLSPTVGQPIKIIGRLTLANCSFRLENRKDTSRQTVNQIHSISWCAGIIRMFHIREM